MSHQQKTLPGDKRRQRRLLWQILRFPSHFVELFVVM